MHEAPRCEVHMGPKAAPPWHPCMHGLKGDASIPQRECASGRGAHWLRMDPPPLKRTPRRGVLPISVFQAARTGPARGRDQRLKGAAGQARLPF